MRKKQIRMIIIIALAVVVLAGVAVLAVSNYGSASDPLVAMSYITDTLTPSMQAKFSAQLDSKADELQASFVSAVSETNGGFATVAMTSGQKLTCSAGSEILLVTGSVQVVNNSAVCDVTAGSASPANTTLAANHLYMVMADGIAVTAAQNATLMVRGTATVS